MVYNLKSDSAETGSENIALDWFRKAVELDPRNVGARIRLAQHLRLYQDRDEKEKQYREALHIDPNHSGTLRNLGILLVHGARYDEAIPLFRRSVAVDPERFEPHSWLNQCYYFLGDEIEALRWSKAGNGSGRGYISTLGGAATYQALLAEFYGDTEEYIDQLRIASKEKTNNYMLLRKLLDSDMRAGRFESALTRYQSYFPYLFSINYEIGGYNDSDTENPMSEVPGNGHYGAEILLKLVIAIWPTTFWIL